MAKFCDCCGQPLPGTEEEATLFDGSLRMTRTGLHWNDGHLRLSKSEALVCMAIARTYPRPASIEFVMDYLENVPEARFDAESSKIIDVFVCKIRKKMFDANVPFHVVTTWGVGKQFAEGHANGRIGMASDYPRDEWLAAKHGEAVPA